MNHETGEPIEVPWLESAVIHRRAEEFLAETHPSGSIPVPIELIVERKGIDIVPMPDLQKTFDIVGFIGGDMSEIRVDEWVFEYRENRYRFTLAHEMGHLALHQELFRAQKIMLLSDFLDFREHLDEETRTRIDWQANEFAGHALVPPAALQQHYERVLPQARQMADNALNGRRTRAMIEGPAWEWLVQELAKKFKVSEQALAVRLQKQGYSKTALWP